MPLMNKVDRLEATILGEKVDRPAYSLWRHFFEKETTAEDLAENMVRWESEYDFDFLKVNPRASYHVEGWGVKVKYTGKPHDEPKVVDYPIKKTEDWRGLAVLSPKALQLDEQLVALSRVKRALKRDTPFVETVFSPLSIAGDLVGSDEQLVKDLRDNPEIIHNALRVITSTFVAFVQECMNAGCWGIFFATTEWARRTTITEAEYQQFGRPYDLEVLAAAREARFNVLHVCGNDAMLYLLSDYPVQAISWATTLSTNPSLEEARARIPRKALIGGLGENALRAPSPERALAEARLAREQTGGRRWILGPACSIPTDTPRETLEAIQRYIMGTELSI